MSSGTWDRHHVTRREFLGVTAAGMGTLILIGCGGGSASSGGSSGGSGTGTQYRIVLIQGVAGDEFYVTMACGAQAKAQELGVKFNAQGPSSFDPTVQTPILNAVVQTKPDAILIAPTDKTAMIAPIQNAVNRGIAVITVDTFITANIALANIATDNLGAGKLAAQSLATQINQQGKVLVVNVKPGISTTDQRQQGFEEGIKQYPNITYLGGQYCNNDPTQAASIVSATLQRHPDLAGIFAANLFAGEGSATGLQNAGKQGKVKLIEFDAGPTEVRALKAGQVQGLIAQNPYAIGQQGVQMAVDYLKTKQPPANKQITTGTTFVTLSNINDPNVSKALYKSSC
jgi:ribose transport system substrate-binding protein